MADLMNFFELNSIYMVLAITLIIWAGIGFYLIKLGSNLKKMESLIYKSSETTDNG